MRILHVIMELLETNGGPPRGLANLARAQAARGDDVAVLPCRRTSGGQTLYPGREGNLVCHEPPTDARLLWYNGAVKRTVRALARGRDIVHIHGTWRYHVLAAAGAARAYGIPFVVRPAGNLGHVTRDYKTLRKRAYFALIERRALDGAAALHCCSEKESAELSGLSLRPRRFIVPQPIDSDLLHVERDEAGLRRLWPRMPAGDPIVLYVGRICSIKNLDVLVEAFVRVAYDRPDWHLVMAGPHEEPDLVAALERRAENAGLSGRVWLPGMVSGGAKAALLGRAAIFAQPSRHENFGLSVAEALMFGLPCVVSDGVALAAEVAKAGAGVSTPSEAGAFETALRRMMDDESFRAQCAARAAGVAQRYSPENVAAALAHEYELCMKSHGTGD